MINSILKINIVLLYQRKLIFQIRMYVLCINNVTLKLKTLNGYQSLSKYYLLSRWKTYLIILPKFPWKFIAIFQDREDFEVRSTAVKQLLVDHGQALVHATINACVFCLPSYMIPDVAEVLFELMLVDRPVRQSIIVFFTFQIIHTQEFFFYNDFFRYYVIFKKCNASECFGVNYYSSNF